MAAHARLNPPSGADRWMVCFGSALAIADRPRRSSEFSAEGTVCHEVAATCMEFGLEPHDFIGITMSADGYSFEITEERAGWITPKLEWLRDQPGKVYIEHQVNLDRWLPDQFGTLDVGIIAPDLITIFDWKFGAGQPVSAVENRQLRIYALGFWDNIARHLTKATRFRIMIAQPRVSGGGGEPWYVELDELLAFGEEVRAAGVKTRDPNACRVASEKGCFWCDLTPERGGEGCPTHEAFQLDLIDKKFEDLDEAEALCAPLTLPQRSQITPERRSFIVQHASMLKRWLAALHDETLADAVAGRPTPNLKAVAGDKGDRKWGDEVKAEAILTEVLADQAFNKKLKSPPQAEKDLKPRRNNVGNGDAWKKLSALIRQDDGKPVLVPESDERPKLKTVDEKFDEEPEQ